jgi:hypothetical protein
VTCDALKKVLGEMLEMLTVILRKNEGALIRYSSRIAISRSRPRNSRGEAFHLVRTR